MSWIHKWASIFHLHFPCFNSILGLTNKGIILFLELLYSNEWILLLLQSMSLNKVVPLKLFLIDQTIPNSPKIRLEKIEKSFKCSKTRQKLSLQSWNWKLLKNTWPIEAKICNKVLEIQANKKVGILRMNDKSTRMKNSKAPYWCRLRKALFDMCVFKA